MSMKQRVLAAVGGVGLTLAIAVTAVTAGGPLGGSASPAGSAATATAPASAAPASTTAAVAAFGFGGFGDFSFPMAGSVDVAAFAAVGMGDPAQCQDVQNKLAANLGVTPAKLQEAIKLTMIQEIDEAEKAGKFTADQAKTARERVNNATDLCAGFGTRVAGPGGQRPGTGQGAVGGMKLGDGATHQAVATYFGITIEQLRQDMTEKGSLQGVAAKYGKDTAAGKAGLQAAIEQALKDDLTKHGLPQEMIDRILADFKANFDTLYTTTMGQGMPFGPGGPGKRPGGPRTSPSPSPTSQSQ